MDFFFLYIVWHLSCSATAPTRLCPDQQWTSLSCCGCSKQHRQRRSSRSQSAGRAGAAGCLRRITRGPQQHPEPDGRPLAELAKEWSFLSGKVSGKGKETKTNCLRLTLTGSGRPLPPHVLVQGLLEGATRSLGQVWAEARMHRWDALACSCAARAARVILAQH